MIQNVLLRKSIKTLYFVIFWSRKSLIFLMQIFSFDSLLFRSSGQCDRAVAPIEASLPQDNVHRRYGAWICDVDLIRASWIRENDNGRITVSLLKITITYSFWTPATSALNLVLKILLFKMNALFVKKNHSNLTYFVSRYHCQNVQAL